MKKKVFALLLIMFLIVPITKVHAEYTIGIPSYDVDPVTGGGTPWEPTKTEIMKPGTGGSAAYGCRFRYAVGRDNEIVVDTYNMEGESVISSRGRVEDLFNAGTWIGVRSKETITATWQIYTSGEFGPEYFRLTKKKTCYYKKDGTPATSSSSNTTTEKDNFNTKVLCEKAASINKKLCTDNGGVITSETGCKSYSTCVENIRNGQQFLDDNCEPGYISTTRYKFSQTCKITTTRSGTSAKTAESVITGDYGTTLTCPDTLQKDGEQYYYTGESRETDNDPIPISPGQVPQEIITKCINKTKETALSLARKYVQEDVSGAKFINLNNYPENGVIAKKDIKTLTNTYEDKPPEETETADGTSGRIVRVVLYRPDRVCLDPKTAEVTYKVGTKESCPNGSYDVTTGKAKDGNTYWRYFIPLNTKSLQPFYFKVEKETPAKLNEKQCLSVIRYYPLNYTKQIVLANNRPLDENVVKALEQVGYNANGTLVNSNKPMCKLQSGITKLPGEVCKYFANKQNLSGYTSSVRVSNGTISANVDKALDQIKTNGNTCQIKRQCTTSSPCYVNGRTKTSGTIWENQNYNTCKNYIDNHPMQNSYIKDIVYKSTADGYTDEMSECTWKKAEFAKEDREVCKIYINNYPLYSDYPNLIRPISQIDSTESYTWDKTIDEKHIKDKDHGCYLSTTINYKISQKFYNEIKSGDEKKIEGYSFYYRPINYDDPFPNGLSVGTSLWDGLYNADENSVDPNFTPTNSKDDIKLSSSFDKITYKTGYINANNVRTYKYNKQNLPYTSWANMSVNGKSDFVNQFVTVTGNASDVYKLGCGPANKSWAVCKK